MRSYRVASVWGIPIRIGVSLLVVVPVLAWLIGSGEQIDLYAGIVGQFPSVALDPTALRVGATPWLIGAAASVGLFVSVALHELGHAWAARRYDIEVESITLWLLGGIASLGEMPREWERELVIALAGPAASVLVAAGCYAVAAALPASLPAAVFVAGWLAVTNLTLVVFNLLPAFPMDGGRVLRALLARSRPYASATRTAARVGSLFAILFAVVGVLSFSPMLLLLALFVYGAANGESRTVALETLLAGATAADVMTTDVRTVAVGTPLSELRGRMLDDRRTSYPVVDGSGSVVGAVSLEQLRRRRRRDAETVGDVMVESVPTVAPDAALFDVVGLLSGSEAGTAVVEADGEVVGTITTADLATALEVRRGAGTPVPTRAAM